MNPDSCQLQCKQSEHRVWGCSWTARLDHRRLGTKEQAEPGSCFSFKSSARFCFPIKHHFFPSDKQEKQQILEIGDFKNLNPNKNRFVYTTLSHSHIRVIFTLAE